MNNVKINASHTIAAADMRRLSCSNRTAWVYNSNATPPQKLRIGAWVLRSFGQQSTTRVGRITNITLRPQAAAHNGDEQAADQGEVTHEYHIKYEDADDEIVSKEVATRYMEQFDSSGFKTTTGWTSPKAGIRQLQRLDKALHKRRRRRARAAAVFTEAANSSIFFSGPLGVLERGLRAVAF